MKKGTDMSAYSVDAIKRRMFEDELQNVIDLKASAEPVVREYFEGRIKEIDKQYGEQYNGLEK